jgi:type I restriction enzyme R subunit
MQAEKQAADPDFVPLNIACVFSPPAEGDADVKPDSGRPAAGKGRQRVDPERQEGRAQGHPRRLQRPLRHQPPPQRVRPLLPGRAEAHQRPAVAQCATSPRHAQHKIDITIVVDMLLTGFDSKYLNTLYVDKNLKHHGLIQAFSRTNRVLNGTKPYGNILDFRQQQDAVDAAIALFSGEKTGEQAREIWLVDKAPVVIEKLKDAVASSTTS